MDIQLIRDFIALAEVVTHKNGGFTQAAERLETDTMKLSRHIRQLEQETGLTLFERTTRKVFLTPSGKNFLPYARSILESWHFGITNASAFQLTASNELNLGSAVPIGSGNIYTQALHECRRKFIRCTLHLTEFSNWSLKSMLRNGDVELILAYHEVNDDNEFISFPLEEDHLVAVMNQSHHLSQASSLDLSELKDEAMVSNPRNSFLGSLIHDVCRAAGFRPRVLYSDNSGSNIAHICDHGGGIGLMTASSARYLKGPHSSVVAIDPEVTLTLCASYRKGHELSPVAREFLAQLQLLKGDAHQC